MRSRNGTSPLLLAAAPLILCAPLGAAQYWIGYRAVTQDALLIRETLSVSPAMTPCGGTKAESVLLDRPEGADLSEVIASEFDAFFALIREQGLHVRHYGNARDGAIRDRILLTLPPRCFTVDFNEDFVRISTLKK